MVDIEEFYEKISNDLDIQFKVEFDENFLKNPNWDSLLNMGLIAHLDREYSITIDFDNLNDHNTITKLYNLVK